MVVLGDNLVASPSSIQEVEDKLDGNPRPANNRLADQHLPFNDDAILPIHDDAPIVYFAKSTSRSMPNLS